MAELGDALTALRMQLGGLSGVTPVERLAATTTHRYGRGKPLLQTGQQSCTETTDVVIPQEVTATLRKPTTLHRLREMHAAGEKLTMLTCYDASFCPHRRRRRCVDNAAGGGDSLGMVLQGRVPARCRSRWMTWRITCVCVVAGETARRSSSAIFRMAATNSHASRRWRAPPTMQAGAQMVKLEGGGWTSETVRFLTERGVPVCAHLIPRAAIGCMHSGLPHSGQDR